MYDLECNINKKLPSLCTRRLNSFLVAPCRPNSPFLFMETALFLSKSEQTLTASINELDENSLPEGDVTVDILFSSLNYKDALAVTGKGAIIRGSYPFIPGIDLVGTVRSSDSSAYKPGDYVIGTGWGIGENHWGGYATCMRLQSKWLVPLPDGMSPRSAMALGTAGFTAMLSIMTLEEHGITPERGEIIVTGATGGVGSLSIALLNHKGYAVVASTGKADAVSYLEQLGASRIIDRNTLSTGPARPMDKGLWAGAVDNVGGKTLATLLSNMKRHGAIASCGLAGGSSLETTVFPFILRGVNLLGIDSNTCPVPRRTAAWNRLNEDLPESLLESISTTIPLSSVPETSETLLAGKIKGRTIVDVKNH